MSEPKTGDDILGMSDEDFLKMSEPPASTPASEEPAPNQEQEQTAEPPVEEEQTTAEEEQQTNEEPAASGSEDQNTNSEPEPNPANEEPNAEQDKNPPAMVDPSKQKDPNAAVAPKDQPASTEQTPVNYEESFKKMMSFKANGKQVELKSPEEAIQLMQMGANYTRKMQELAPVRKTMLMLQQNGLLEGDTLSFFIDLKNGNKEAIKKLVKDSGIDPMDLDTGTESQYRATNHAPSDNEVRFASVLDDIKSTPQGMQTIQTLGNLDQASQDALWQQPELMSVLNEQRANGIFDTISAEVDRRKMLGIISSATPFLQAYTLVGNELQAQNAFAPRNTTPAPVPAAPVVTRPMAPKPRVSNNDRVNAASPSRSTPSSAKKPVNYLAMSDDDFLKQFENRL